MTDAADITRLLQAVAAGNATALEQLLPQVYGELRRIAAARLRRESVGHTLNPTDLVHEAYLKLVPLGNVEWQSRSHFFAIASRAMRQVLVDHAERRSAAKRGGGQVPLTLTDDGSATATPLDDLIALGDALSRLERVDPRQARVVECRFFGGLSLDETAEALNISAATVSRDWTFARAWLHRELDVGGGDRLNAPAAP
jgi:RNA polymerase sigma factor (TIGR02999 family)